MKALGRVQRVKNTWDFLDVSLEVANAIAHGGVRRFLIRKIRGLAPAPQPAKIRVKSERGPIR